jgi:hypothetical protein
MSLILVSIPGTCQLKNAANFGTVIANVTTLQNNSFYCQMECQRTVGCLYFNFDPINGTCLLLSTEGNVINDLYITGPKLCGDISNGKRFTINLQADLSRSTLRKTYF